MASSSSDIDSLQKLAARVLLQSEETTKWEIERAFDARRVWRTVQFQRELNSLDEEEQKAKQDVTNGLSVHLGDMESFDYCRKCDHHYEYDKEKHQGPPHPFTKEDLQVYQLVCSRDPLVRHSL